MKQIKVFPNIKKLLHRASIRWKIIASYAVIALLTAVIVGIVSFSIIKFYMNRQEEVYLEEVAKYVATKIQPALNAGYYNQIQQIVETLGMLANIHIKILDTDKNITVDSKKKVNPLVPSDVTITFGIQFFNKLYDDAPRNEKMSEEEMDNAPVGTMMEYEDGEKGKYYIIPVTGDRGVLGYIELSEGPDFSRSAVPARNALFLAGIFAVIAACLIGLLMGNMIAGPLSLLAKSVSRIREDNLHVRSEIKREDEIGILSRQFNLMAQRLEKSFTQIEKERDILKHFAADASHELRTPVTALTTFNELLSGPLGDDSESRIEYLGDCRTQIKRMEWIINNLLELSRYDGSLIDLVVEYCPIDEIVETAVSSVISGINDKNITIVREIEEGALRCDQQRIVQALVNLISNAVKYTEQDGQIVIKVETEGTKNPATRFSVLDSGPGIPEDDIFNIFKRFYRAAPKEVPGTGLGLSLVESITRAHHGIVRARNREPVGADVSFLIPNKTSA